MGNQRHASARPQNKISPAYLFFFSCARVVYFPTLFVVRFSLSVDVQLTQYSVLLILVAHGAMLIVNKPIPDHTAQQ